MDDTEDQGQRSHPVAGEVEERSSAALEVEGRRVRGVVPYGVESRDMGGWREVIEPTAFRATNFDELRAVIDHKGVPLASYPRTLQIEDRADGLHWSFDPPRSRQDVVEAIERGDLRSGSWRMVVARDRWQGDTRHVDEISHLHDVTLVAAERPAYPAASSRVPQSTQPGRRPGGQHGRAGRRSEPGNPGAARRGSLGVRWTQRRGPRRGSP